MCFDMSDRVGISGKEPFRWKEYLVSAGFTDVVEKILKIPTKPRPKYERMEKIGASEVLHFRDGNVNISTRGHTQIL